MVGPDFHKPDPHPPSVWADPGQPSYPTSRPTAYSLAPADLSAWWERLNDDELTSLVERSIAANLDLKRATSAVRQARFAVSIAAGELFPQVNANGQYEESSRGNHGVSSGLYRVGLDASWEIDLFGRIRRQVEAADATYQAAVESRRDVLVSVVAEVAADYVDLRGVQRQLEIAQGNLKLQQKNLDIVLRKNNGGNGFNTGLDIEQAKASVAGTASQIPVLETQARQDIYALGVLLNRPPEDLIGELSPHGALPVAPLDVPIGLPSDLIRRRPDIRAAEAQVHVATAGIGIAIADLFPRVSLTGSFEQTSRKPASLFDWANHTFSYGPNVSFPVFDAGIIFNNIAIQDEVAQQAILTYRQTVLTALQDVENSLIAYVKEYEHRAALADEVTAYQKAVDIATVQYTNGTTDFLNVLTAQQSLFGSENSLVQSDRATVTDLIALYKALGGGWEPATTPRVTPPPTTTRALPAVPVIAPG